MESAKPPLSLGSSLLVPSVQELVKQPMNTIPPRYVRPELEYSRIITSSVEIPVIDFRKLYTRESIESELEKLHLACRDWGFFQLVNHEVSCSLIEKIKVEIQQFFRLPIEEKKRYWQQPGDLEGFGQSFVVSDEQKLDWSDSFFLTMLPPEQRKSHLYGNLPPSFRETLEAYSQEQEKLAKELMGLMAKALGIEKKDVVEVFEGGLQAMRMNCYPPCPRPGEAIGLSPHSDASGLTFVFQVNDVEGLQIRKDGTWVLVKPLPDAFVVNIGDALEIVTNGIYPSIEHRAVVNSDEERLTIATFNSPKLGAEVGPAQSLITKEKPARFKTLATERYLREYFARKLEGKSKFEYLRIEEAIGEEAEM